MTSPLKHNATDRARRRRQRGAGRGEGYAILHRDGAEGQPVGWKAGKVITRAYRPHRRSAEENLSVQPSVIILYINFDSPTAAAAERKKERRKMIKIYDATTVNEDGGRVSQNEWGRNNAERGEPH